MEHEMIISNIFWNVEETNGMEHEMIISNIISIRDKWNGT